MKRDRAQKSQAAQTHRRMKTDCVHDSLHQLIISFNVFTFIINCIFKKTCYSLAGVDAEGLRVGTDGPAPRQTEAGEGGHLLQGPGHLGCLQYSAGVRGAAAGQGAGREEEVEHYVWYSAFRLSFTYVDFVRAGKVCYLRGSCLKDTVMRWRYIYWIDTEQLESRNWD